jgi:putative DNA methylase
MDRLLDRQLAGPAYLRIPEVAQLVVDSIEHGARTDYFLHAWVVMPNHVHLLITPCSSVSKLLQKLKGSTAREANKLLDRAGVAFWQDESYDRLVRNPEEFRRIAKYIIENPVKARLARSAEQYRWSSAWNGGLKPAAG